jgi:hypothetical protein
VPVEHPKVGRCGVELVHRHRHHVVLDVADLVLVQVVADPRAVGEQLLHRHPVVHQWQVVA